MKKILIIAEAGVNHNGDLSLAKKLIVSAKKAGAHYIKFQSFKANNLVTKNAKSAGYQIKNMKKNVNQFKILKKLELSYNDHLNLKNYSKKKKIKFISSPFDLESLRMLFNLKIYDIKIPSGEINNYILLKNIAKKAKKIFLSTGMATMNEIKQALQVLTLNGASMKRITVLHCHTDYPSNLYDINLLAMDKIKKTFKKIDVGYSDHTLGNETAIAAVALGAKVIEKHITLNKKLPGPDHKASLTPDEFKNYIKSINNTIELLGTNKKAPSLIEIKNKKLVRKSIVAKKFIKKGQKFSENNITCKRPEGGLSPMKWKILIGKKSKKNFKEDEFIYL